MIDVLTYICNKIWKTREWPTTLTHAHRNATCNCVKTAEPSALSAIIVRSGSHAKEIIAEEQSGFRAGRSTTDKLFNLRITCKKYLKNHHNLCHVFIMRLQEESRQGKALSLMSKYE